MSRSSPAVHRVAGILNFIADHPGQSFVLTDVVRALKLSRATAHALMTGLVDVGYLYRASDKSYVLGPALARIGRSVAEHFSPLAVAQPEMRALADEFDVVCSAFVLEGEAAVVRERAASGSHVGYAAPLGARVRLRPQSAAVFFAWSPESTADDWLDSLTPPPSDEQRRQLFDRMAVAREYGFVLIVSMAPAAAFGDEPADPPVTLAAEVRDDETYLVASMLAPVFDEGGRVAFALGLGGFGHALSGGEVREVGRTLVAACGRISHYIVGRAR